MRRPSLRDERGFTLIEMLVAATIGVAVLFAAFQLVTISTRAAQRVSDRVASSTNGRNAMEQIVQELRSNVCLDNTSGAVAPIAAGTSTSVSFYTALTSPSGTGTAPFAVQLRTISYNAATRTLKEDRSASTGTYPALTFPTVTSSRVIASDVHPTPGVPMFSFFAYKADNTVDVFHDTPLSVPLSASGLATTGAVRVAFTTGPGRTTNYKGVEASFDEAVPLRLVDLSNAQVGPQCYV